MVVIHIFEVFRTEIAVISFYAKSLIQLIYNLKDSYNKESFLEFDIIIEKTSDKIIGKTQILVDSKKILKNYQRDIF